MGAFGHIDHHLAGLSWARMNTIDLLKTLYPPVSYDVSAPFLSATIAADAAVLDDVLSSAFGLLAEVFPDTAAVGLSDWERVYGLPDRCLGKTAGVAARRAFLLSKINDSGGIRNVDYVARVKALLDADVSVTEFGARSCGDPCDAQVFDEDWRYVWEVHSRSDASMWYRSCGDPCDAQLDYYDNAALVYLLNSHAPAGTLPLVSYGS